MHAELQSVSLRIVTLKSTAAMSDAMKGVTIAMMRMNRAINMPQMQKIMMEFRMSKILKKKRLFVVVLCHCLSLFHKKVVMKNNNPKNTLYLTIIK